MPNKLVEQFITEFKELKTQFAIHIEESGNIKTDIKWLKWFIMGIAGGMGAILVSLFTFLLKH